MTIKPYQYGRIAHEHNRVALTARAVGDRDTEARERHKRDVTIKRARAIKEQLKRAVS